MSQDNCKCGVRYKEVGVLEQFPEKKAKLLEHIGSLELSDSLERRRGVLIGCLHKAQAIFGYLPQEVQELVADCLRLRLSDVYGVVSFYSFFTTKPVGKYKINVCTGTACFVKGAGDILEEFKNKLNIDEGETTADKLITLSSIRCLGACSLAPVVMVNDKVYAGVTVRMVVDIITGCK